MLRRAPRYVCLAVPLLVLVGFAGVPRAGAAPRPQLRRLALTENAAFTLRRVDARCFYADGGTRPGWPWRGRGPFPIRGSFNEVRARSGSHFGVDVSAPRDQAEVRSMTSGTVFDRTKHTLSITDSPGHRWIYWHLQTTAQWHKHMHVAARQVIGSIIHNYWHVHVSERVKGCGYVDPEAPHRELLNPANTQTPMIGALSADVADRPRVRHPPGDRGRPAARPRNARAPRSPARDRRPPRDGDGRGAAHAHQRRGGHDAHPQPGGLGHPGVADHARQAARASGDAHDHGWGAARLAPNLWHKWAWGTWRSNGCFYGHGTCSQTMVWHVGGQHGLDTSAYPNGRYLYCVEALTIDNVANTRCTDVAIAN